MILLGQVTLPVGGDTGHSGTELIASVSLTTAVFGSRRRGDCGEVLLHLLDPGVLPEVHAATGGVLRLPAQQEECLGTRDPGTHLELCGVQRGACVGKTLSRLCVLLVLPRDGDP